MNVGALGGVPIIKMKQINKIICNINLQIMTFYLSCFIYILRLPGFNGAPAPAAHNGQASAS